MTAHTDKPSDAQMAQALEWFHRRISSFIGLDDAQRDHCAAIEEALLNYQAPSVRTVSRDAVADTPRAEVQPVAWMCEIPSAKYSNSDKDWYRAFNRTRTSDFTIPVYTHPPRSVSVDAVSAGTSEPVAWMHCNNCKIDFRTEDVMGGKNCPHCKCFDQYTFEGHSLSYMRVYKDGSAWCATKHDFINLQESHAGFGGTPSAALADFHAHRTATPPNPELEQARVALAGCLTHSKRATDGDWAIISDTGHYDTMSTIIGGLRDDSRKYPVWELVVEVGGKQPVSAQEASTRLIVTAVNFIRDHGPTILAALDRAK